MDFSLEKMNQNTLLIICVLIVFVVYYFTRKSGKTNSHSSDGKAHDSDSDSDDDAGGDDAGGGDAGGDSGEGDNNVQVNVYGTDQCGWTVRWKEWLDKAGVDYKYVDCSQNAEACVGMQGYPTTKVEGVPGLTVIDGADQSKIPELVKAQGKTPEQPSPDPNPTPSGGSNVMVYGTDQCGWTVKWKQMLDEKCVDYTYVDCSQNGEACSGMQGYPTTKVNGVAGVTEIVGANPTNIDKLPKKIILFDFWFLLSIKCCWYQIIYRWQFYLRFPYDPM